MSVATATRPRFSAAKLFDLKPLPSEREPTLAEVVQLAWVCMQAEGLAPCPVCHGAMDADGCRDCASRLE